MSVEQQEYQMKAIVTFDSWDRFFFSVADYRKILSLDEGLRKRVAECHIYMIGKRPRLYVEPSSIIIHSNGFDARFIFRKGNSTLTLSDQISWEELNLTPREIIEVRASKFPHNYLELIGPSGAIQDTIFPSLNAQAIEHAPEWIKDLEIVYIGKGGNRDSGTRSAIDRLEAHSTLQRILAEVTREEPENELFIVLWQFTPPKYMFPLPSNVKLPSAQEAKRQMLEISSKKISPETEMAFIEGALISYFKPWYNEMLKESFPHPQMKIIRELLEMGLYRGLYMYRYGSSGNSNLFSVSEA